MFRHKLFIVSLITMCLLFIATIEVKGQQKEIIMGGTDYSFIFEDRIILGEEGEGPTSTRLFVDGTGQFTGPLIIADAVQNNEAVSKLYVDPYLTFWNVDGNEHVHNINSGRIGINMNTSNDPQAQLQINAPSTTEALRIISASDYSPFNIRDSVNENDIWRIDQTGSLAVGSIPWERVQDVPASYGSNWNVSGNDISNKNSGNVGIGTSSPLQKLHIYDIVDGGYVAGRIENFAGSGAADFDFKNSVQLWKIGVNVASNFRIRDDTNNANVFTIEDGANADSLYIDSSARVGLSTSSPVAKLSVAGESGVALNVGGGHIAGLDLTPLDNDYAVSKHYVDNNFISSTTLPTITNSFIHAGNTFGNTAILGTQDNYALSFITNNTQKMIILADGNVGIGTTNPVAKLHSLTTGADTTGRFERDGLPSFMEFLHTGGNAELAFNVNDLTDFTIGIDDQASGDPFKISANSGLGTNDLVTIQSDGNVGIGTTSPSTPVHIRRTDATKNFLTLAGDRNAGDDEVGILFRDRNAVTSGGGEAGRIYTDRLGTSDDFDLVFESAEGNSLSEAMRIQHDGNVGIGTASPITKLAIGDESGVALNVGGGHIAGLDLTPADDDYAVSKHYVDNNFIHTGGGSLWAESGSDIYYNTGNVGIGTTSPDYPLHVEKAGTGVVNIAKFAGNAGLINFRSDTNYNRMTFGIENAIAGSRPVFYTNVTGETYSRFGFTGDGELNWGAGTTDHDTNLYRNSANVLRTNDSLIIDGNVGIGTSNPGSLLTIANNNWISSINGAGTSHVNMFRLNTSNKIEVGAPLMIGSFEFAADSGLVSFVDMPVTSASPLADPQAYIFKIDGTNIMSVYSESNGVGGIQSTRVGIGTVEPSSLLTLQGGSLETVGESGVAVNVGGGHVAGLDLTPAGDNYAATKHYVDNNFLSASGGIPWSAMAGYSAGPPATLTFNGDMYADSFFHNSDASLKTNIVSLEDSLDKLKKLNPVSFSWKNGDKRTHLGFIAQEVEVIFPELVATNSKTGLKSVQYANFSAVIVDSIKEQQNKIDLLEREIQVLKKQIAILLNNY